MTFFKIRLGLHFIHTFNLKYLYKFKIYKQLCMYIYIKIYVCHYIYTEIYLDKF